MANDKGSGFEGKTGIISTSKDGAKRETGGCEWKARRGSTKAQGNLPELWWRHARQVQDGQSLALVT